MKKLIFVCSLFVFASLLLTLNARATLYWDPDLNGANNNTNTGVGLGGTGTWTNTAVNWYYTNTTDNVWTNNDTAVFWGTAGTVTLGGAQGIANVVFKTGGYTITGSTITNTGSPSLYEVDTGTATIASTIVNAASTTGYTVFGGGTLNLTSSGNNQVGTITITTNSTLEIPNSHPIGTGSGTIAMDNGGTLRNDSVSAADAWCLSGYTFSLGTGGGIFNATNSASIFLCTNSITGGGSLTKNGLGEIRITKASAYTGGLIVNNGVFTAGHSAVSAANTFFGAVPASPSATAITLQNGGSLRLAGGANVTLNANQGITLGTGGGALRAVGGLVLTGASPIIGSADLTVGVSFDTGTVTLTGTNSYTGKTIVNGGTLSLNNPSGLDTVLGTAPGSAIANQISLNGCTLSVGSAANVVLSANRGVTLTGVNTNSLSNTKDLTIPGNIAGAGSLIKSGANTLTLSGTNTFSGGFTILGGGLNFNANDSAGHSNIIVGPTTAAVTLRNTVTTSTVTNNIVINGGGTSDIDTFVPSGNTMTYSGLISGSGTLFRGKGGGAGNIIITGNNTGYSGAVNLYQGLLTLGNKNALGTGTFTIGPGSVAVILQAGSPMSGASAFTNAVNLACTNKAFTIAGSNDLEFSGPINLASAGTATNASITVTSTGATILSGVRGGPANVGLTNGGSGVLTISSVANTYTGPTVVNGNLKVTGSIASSSAVTIGNGGTLSGPGTVSTLAINSGGTVSPGGSPGTLSSASETWAGGGHYKFEMNAATGTAGTDPGWDRLNITGGLNITASSGTPFLIDLASLTLGNVAGSVSDFDNTTNYSWSIATTSAGITNFNASAFTVNTAGFTNALASGGFSVTTNSTDILLLFVQKPIITSLSPTNPAITVGDSVTFTVTATGVGPLTYQWQKAGSNIGGATNTSYAIVGAHVSDAATYRIVVSNPGGSVTNSTILSVAKADQTVNFVQTNVTYGIAPISLGGTATSGLSVSYTLLSGPASLAGSTLTITGAGAVSVQADQAGNVDYNVAPSVTNNFTVSPALLTVTADNLSRPFGATNPILTVSYTNFVNGQTLGTSDVGGAPVLTTSADTNSDVGTYTITNDITALTSTNYVFVPTNGTLTVTNAVSTNAVVASTNVALPATPVTFTSTLSALATSLAVPTNAVQFLIDGTTNGVPVFPVAGVTSFTNSSLTHGNHTIEADYTGDTNGVGATNILGSTNSVNVLIDIPPSAGAASYVRPRDIPLNINITGLLTNASDVDGDVVSFTSVSSTSTNGATISNTNSAGVTNGFFAYTPPSTNGNVTDTFTYTVQDSFGVTSSNTVTVTILPDNNGPSVNITDETVLGNGTVQLGFAGIPGRNYLIQATTNLTPTIIWTTLSTNLAGTNGLFQFTDLEATNYGTRYYRTATP